MTGNMPLNSQPEPTRPGWSGGRHRRWAELIVVLVWASLPRSWR